MPKLLFASLLLVSGLLLTGCVTFVAADEAHTYHKRGSPYHRVHNQAAPRHFQVPLLYVFGGRSQPYRERHWHGLIGPNYGAVGRSWYTSDTSFLLPGVFVPRTNKQHVWVRVMNQNGRVLRQRTWFRLRTSLRIPGSAAADCYLIPGTGQYPAPLYNCLHEWTRW